MIFFICLISRKVNLVKQFIKLPLVKSNKVIKNMSTYVVVGLQLW